MPTGKDIFRERKHDLTPQLLSLTTLRLTRPLSYI
jgi:hypothetical protein